MLPLGGLDVNRPTEAVVAEKDAGVRVHDTEPFADGSQDAGQLLALDADLREHGVQLGGHVVETQGQGLELPSPPRRDLDPEIARGDPGGGLDELPDGPGDRPGEKGGREQGQSRGQADDPEQIPPELSKERLEVPHEQAHAQDADDRSVRLERNAHVHHLGPESGAEPDGHLLFALEGGEDLRTEEVVLHVPGLFLGVGQDVPPVVDDRDPPAGPGPYGRDHSVQSLRRLPREEGNGPVLDEVGQVLKMDRLGPDEILPHERGAGQEDRRDDKGDDQEIAREDLQEKRSFHSSTL